MPCLNLDLKRVRSEELTSVFFLTFVMEPVEENCESTCFAQGLLFLPLFPAHVSVTVPNILPLSNLSNPWILYHQRSKLTLILIKSFLWSKIALKKIHLFKKKTGETQFLNYQWVKHAYVSVSETFLCSGPKKSIIDELAKLNTPFTCSCLPWFRGLC